MTFPVHDTERYCCTLRAGERFVCTLPHIPPSASDLLLIASTFSRPAQDSWKLSRALPVIKQLLDDVPSWTGVVLAEILLAVDRGSLVIEYLLGALSNDNLMVRLQALETIVDTKFFDPALRLAVEALVPDDAHDRPCDGRLAKFILKE